MVINGSFKKLYFNELIIGRLLAIDPNLDSIII